jgi:peptide/nickel transport system substrate-binding protein
MQGTSMRRSGPSTTRRSLAVGLLALSLIAASCGGSKAGDSKKSSLDSAGLTSKDGESGLSDAGKPKRGGTLIYGMEAESTGGFCLPEGQLAISGMLVVRAVYDTLTVPNAEGDYVPYLAKDITHNDDYTSWTIKLREGVKFHDGSDLDATVVKNNIDAYRGKYKGRNPLLFLFVLANIKDTKVVDDLTVQVDMTKPWVAFPAYLYSSSRMGIMGQSQLDDPKTCDRKLVGTGPFKFKSWNPNQKLNAVRNPDYWQTAPDGKPYPYADAIEFRPIPDAQVRVNALEGGDVNIIHNSNAEQIGGKLRQLRDDGKVNMLVSEDSSEPAFVQLNNTKPPFDDIRMRKALAMGADRAEINESQNDGLPTVADGPFAPDSVGYLKDTGFPKYDLAAAKKLVKEYVAEGGKAEFNLTATTDQSVQRLAQLIQQRAQKTGVKVNIISRDQAALIDDAIGKSYEAMVFRNYPGGDPDINYVWWYGVDNPVNFGGYNDPTINKLLDEGRGETDPAKRKEIYQDINRQFAKQVYAIWAWYTPWAIIEDKSVHGVWGPPLPGDDASKPGELTTDDKARQPSTGLATAHSLIGLWIDS